MTHDPNVDPSLIELTRLQAQVEDLRIRCHAAELLAARRLAAMDAMRTQPGTVRETIRAQLDSRGVALCDARKLDAGHGGESILIGEEYEGHLAAIANNVCQSLYDFDSEGGDHA